MSETVRPSAETYEHIRLVQRYLNRAIVDLIERAEAHDASKLEDPEVDLIEAHTPKLRGLTYGSEEYRAVLREIKPAIDHHYARNDHHPEHFPDGIRGMSLLSLLEMVCDWAAATRRHADGDLGASIALNRGRFGYSNELEGILRNTATELGLFRDELDE